MLHAPRRVPHRLRPPSGRFDHLEEWGMVERDGGDGNLRHHIRAVLHRPQQDHQQEGGGRIARLRGQATHQVQERTQTRKRRRNWMFGDQEPQEDVGKATRR